MADNSENYLFSSECCVISGTQEPPRLLNLVTPAGTISSVLEHLIGISRHDLLCNPSNKSKLTQTFLHTINLINAVFP